MIGALATRALPLLDALLDEEADAALADEALEIAEWAELDKELRFGEDTEIGDAEAGREGVAFALDAAFGELVDLMDEDFELDLDTADEAAAALTEAPVLEATDLAADETDEAGALLAELAFALDAAGLEDWESVPSPIAWWIDSQLMIALGCRIASPQDRLIAVLARQADSQH